MTDHDGSADYEVRPRPEGGVESSLVLHLAAPGAEVISQLLGRDVAELQEDRDILAQALRQIIALAEETNLDYPGCRHIAREALEKVFPEIDPFS